MAALKSRPARLGRRQFTTAQAAAMLKLDIVEVNNLIDEMAAAGIARKQSGQRRIERNQLFMLLLARDLVSCQLKPELRKRTLKLALGSSSGKVDVPGSSLSVLLKPAKDEARDGLRALSEAESSIAADEGVMQGEPCLKGTRVPAYMIARLAEQGGEQAVRKAYPFLSPTQIAHAMLFAKAHPRRGRPRATQLPATPRKSIRKSIALAKVASG